MQRHTLEVKRLSEIIRKNPSNLALKSTRSHNTTRSKSYNENRLKLDVSKLNRVLEVDREKKVALVEPKVTMEELVLATLPFGLVPKVVPEFKGITVGGAIMGAAGESSSHKFGLFHDTCSAYEVLLGNGEMLRLDSTSPLFHAIPGSYGSLGLLTLAEIELMKAPNSVHLRPHIFEKQGEALEKLKNSSADFADALIFSKSRSVVIEGHFSNEPPQKMKRGWYCQRAHEERIHSFYDYFFRYDRGAFWMGAYLLNPVILTKFLLEGVFKIKRGSSIQKHPAVSNPRLPLSSKMLWKLHHKAETWVQERFLVQDCCIPENQSALFLESILDDPGIFPIWICPIKGTPHPQIFAPHMRESLFFNFGLYGIPAIDGSLEEITKRLEQRTALAKGRKVLYSRSYYTPEEFWSIYSKEPYTALRKEMQAEGVWQEITEKVLSP